MSRGLVVEALETRFCPSDRGVVEALDLNVSDHSAYSEERFDEV